MDNQIKLSKSAVLYCRVSTVEQADEGNSLVTQERACREYAYKNGFSVPEEAGVYIERGESAKTADRTQLQKMLMYCAQKKNSISAVIVYKIDRLSRNTDDYSQLRIFLKRYGVAIKSATEHMEDSPVGRFMENTMANVAQFDNDIRAERCSNGMREAVREGRYVWNASVGYSNVRVADKATIAQNDVAQLVLRAFELVATATYTTDEVWKMVCKEGLRMKNDKPPSRNYFYQMLRNEIYMGWIAKFGERHKGLFDPIVSEELFAQVQRVLRNKGHKVAEYKTDNPEFPLRRFVLNPAGLKLTGSIAKGKYPYYRFNGASGNYERDELEKCFMKLMDSYRFDDSQIRKLKDLVRKRFHDTTAEEHKEAHKIEARLKELAETQSALVRKNLKGVLSDSVLQQELVRIEKEEIGLRATLAIRINSAGSPEEAVEVAEEYLRQPSAVWRKASIATQTKLQWFQFPSGTTFDGKIFGTPKISCVFKTKDAITAPLSVSVDPRRFELLTPSLQMRCSTS